MRVFLCICALFYASLAMAKPTATTIYAEQWHQVEQLDLLAANNLNTSTTAPKIAQTNAIQPSTAIATATPTPDSENAPYIAMSLVGILFSLLYFQKSILL